MQKNTKIALGIAANPEPFARTPWVYARAWSHLMANKGRKLRPIPGGPKHRIERAPMDIPARVREIAKAKGYKTGPRYPSLPNQVSN